MPSLRSSGKIVGSSVGVGGNGRIGQIGIDDANGENAIAIGGPQGAGCIGLGGNNSRGQGAIFDENTNVTINLGGIEGAARIGLGGNGSVGTIDVFDAVIDVFNANSNQTPHPRDPRKM